MTILDPVLMNTTFNVRWKLVSAINHFVAGIVLLLALVSSRNLPVRFTKHCCISLGETGGTLVESFSRTLREMNRLTGFFNQRSRLIVYT
jgi:hypothetical protein